MALAPKTTPEYRHLATHATQIPLTSTPHSTRKSPRLALMPFAHRESKVYVAKSAVSGYGVYSKQIIRKGEIVCLYSGVVLGASAMLGNTSDYVLDLGGGWYLDGADRYNCSGRYINDARGFREFRNNTRYSSTLIWDDELG